MEEIENTNKKDIYAYLVKYLPYIIFGFVILLTGLSFIGHQFTVTHLEGESLITLKVSLSTLLFTQEAGYSTQVFFIISYFVLPILVGVLLLFSAKHPYFKAAALIIYLTLGVSSIVIKDLYLEAIYHYYKVVLGVKYSFEITELTFIYFVPIICYFVSFILTCILSIKELTFGVEDITEMGVFIAVAIGLNFIKILPMPTGGSINLQMLPLFFLALRRGPFKGFIAGGVVYGVISCLIDGYGFATFPLDYLLGFGSIAVIGFFSPLIIPQGQKTYTIKGELLLLIAGIIATTIRFIAGTVSSMVIYGYDLIPAMTYNSLYVYISGALSLAIIMSLLGPISRINTRYPVENA